MLHLLFKENEEAVRAARNFIDFMEDSLEYRKRTSDKPFVLTKLYFMNIICNMEEDKKLEEQMVLMLRKL